MANNFLSPNMNLVVPVVGVDPGPNWADDLNSSLITIDGHNHAFGSGVQINPDGININTDLSFNSNNAIQLRSVRFINQMAPLALPTDIGCLYESVNELYYNDGIGNQVKITNLGSVAGAAGTITGLPSGTASAAYISADGTFQFQQATATAANIDVASVIIRYPGSYPTPAGNAIILEAPTSLASQYSLTLPSLPSQTNVMTLSSVGIISSITYDQVGQNMTSVGADAIANNRTRTVGNPAPLGGIAQSASSGAFSTTSTSPVTVVSATLTTSGLRPVMVQIISNGGNSYLQSQASGNPVIFTLQRALTPFCMYEMQNPLMIPSSSLSGIDFPGPATLTYSLLANVTSGGSVQVNDVYLIAYEL